MAVLDACTLLKQADQAWFDLSAGGAVRAVTDQNGERVEYTSANRAGMLAMMRVLQAQCLTYTAVALGGAANKPMKFLF